MYGTKGKKQSIIALVICIALMVLGALFFDDSILKIYVCVLLISAWILYVFGDTNVLSPITLFYIMYVFFIALGPLAYFLFGVKFNESYYWIIIVSLYTFIFGYITSRVIKKGNRKNYRSWSLKFNNKDTIVLICQIILLVAVLFKIYYLISNRGLLFSGSLNDGRIQASSSNGMIIYIGNLWSPASCILIELHIKGRKINAGTAFIILIAVALDMLSGFRTGVIGFALILVLMINKHKKINLVTIISLGVVAILFMSMYESLREGRANGTEIIRAIFNQAYVGLINLGYVFKTFPNRHNFLWGYGYLINIIMLKPGPDLDFTLTLKEMMGLTFSGGGVTPTIIGEFYLNFGMIGLFLGMFLIGIILRKIENLYKNSDMYYIPAFLIVELILAIRSGLANIEISLIINITMYYIICYFSRKYRLKLR